MNRGSDTVQRDRSCSSGRGSVPVIGDVLLVGVALLIAVFATLTVFNLAGLLTENSPVAHFEFEYDEDVAPTYADSFNTTNADGRYDGLLTVTHTDGRTIPAGALYVDSVSSLADRTSWASTVAAGDGPSYTSTERIGAGDRLEIWVQHRDLVQVIWLSEQDAVGAVLVRWDGRGAG